MKKERGITLIALIVTIIVLLILLSVGISMLTGENGILNKASKAKEKYLINQEKEKIELAIMELRIEEESKGEKLSKEKLKKLEGTKDEISIGQVDSFPVEAISGGYKFYIDENYKVTYVGESDSTQITYTTQPEEYTDQDNIVIKLKIKNSKGIKEIHYPNEEKVEQENGKKEIAIDYTVTKNGTYTFKVVDNEGKETNKDIEIQLIDKVPPKDFTITAEATDDGIMVTAKAEDGDATDESVKSGIQKYEYYVTDLNNNTTKYDTNKITDLTLGTYSVYVIAYDRAENTVTSNTVSNIKTGYKNITAQKVAQNPTLYYGKTVTNYTSKNGQTDWKIFYSNGENIFLITGDYLENSKIDTTKAGMTTEGTYNAYWETVPSMQTVTDETKNLFMATGYELNSNNDNSKYVSTLLNTDNWTEFKDTKGMANSVIGGSTIEMWIASWNNLYPSNKLYCNNTNESGYYVGTSTTSTDSRILTSNENKLYFPHTEKASDGCLGFWLSSPSISTNICIYVDISGFLCPAGGSYDVLCIRPIVCLKSGITVNCSD